MDFFSLGSTCQTAHQIRRYTKNNQAYFFDWLISNNDSYKALLIDFETQLSETECSAIEVVETSVYTGETANLGKIRVIDKVSGLEYQHEFPLNEQKFIDEKRITEHLPTAKQKFGHLRNKTIEAIGASSDPILVRYENIRTPQEGYEIASQIKTLYSDLNPNSKVVIASCFLEEELSDGDIYISKIAKPTSWKGDDSSWDRLFRKLDSSTAA